MVKRVYPKTVEELPEWVAELKGFGSVAPMLLDAPHEGAEDIWHVNMMLPADTSTTTDDLDPLVTLIILAYGRARIEDKVFETVQVCRDQGKSWTQIGQVLGVSKQSAWERFSGED